jgi:hypothetical protein
MKRIDKNSEWEDRFRELQAFHQQFGHCQVPKRAAEFWRLARWIGQQLTRHWNLPVDRVRELFEMGFPFLHHDRQWLGYFFKLMDFKKKHGHCIVPWKWRDDPALNSWAGTQRCRRMRLHPGRRRRLDELGFVWNLFEHRWEQFFERLKAFYKAHGKLLARRDYRAIVGWASLQRKRRTQITTEQIRKLDSIGFDWDPFNSLWRGHVKALRAFKKRFGHCYVPQAWTEDPSLGIWVNELRHKRKKLSTERIAELDRIGFSWDFRDFAGLAKTPSARPVTYSDGLWTKRYLALKAFKEKYGHCRIPARWPQNRALATWVVRQRTWRDKLLPDRRRKLESLDFTWSPFEEDSLHMLGQLEDFKKEQGHCNVPMRYPKNQPLAGWIERLRARRREKQGSPSLSAQVLRRLNSIGFVWRVREPGTRPASP